MLAKIKSTNSVFFKLNNIGIKKYLELYNLFLQNPVKMGDLSLVGLIKHLEIKPNEIIFVFVKDCFKNTHNEMLCYCLWNNKLGFIYKSDLEFMENQST